MKSKKIRNNKNKSRRLITNMNGGGKCNSKSIKGEATIYKKILNDSLFRLRNKENINIQEIKEIKELVKLGADVDDRDDYFQRTFLHEACYTYRNIELVKTLIDNCADVNARDKYNNTPLHLALKQGFNMELVNTLIDKGADVNARNNDGYTPLLLALTKYGLYYFNILLNSGADVNARYKDYNTLLHLLCKNDDIIRAAGMNGNIELANILINKGADINARDKYQNTPLHMACKNGNIELANILINKGADINAENALEESPFDYIDLNDYKQYGLNPDDEKLRSRFYKDGVYELRKYKDVYVPIMIIPKGTILFRSVEEGIDDFCGIPNDETNKYCLNQSYNVFFYPYPAYREPIFKIFVVEKTLKIVNMIYPSYFSRGIRHSTKYDFIQNCSEVELDFCEGQAGSPYDPCFSEEFLKENPDIAGMICLAELDTPDHKKKYTNLNKYSLLHRDVRGEIGVPELILHPKQTRQISDKYWDEQECVEENNSVKENNNYSYLIDSNNNRVNIMESLLNPKGYNIKRSGVQSPFTQKDFDKIHVTLYNPLKMYVVWEYLEENYKKECVPINFSANSKLSQFQNDINKLNDELYKKNVTTLKKFWSIVRGGKSKKRKSRRNKTHKKSNK